jgi:hypothetical protein
MTQLLNLKNEAGNFTVLNVMVGDEAHDLIFCYLKESSVAF